MNKEQREALLQLLGFIKALDCNSGFGSFDKPRPPLGSVRALDDLLYPANPVSGVAASMELK